MPHHPLTFKLALPSKTFLVGEYAVLKGAPALILTTKPHFEFHACEGRHSIKGIHPDSPAGKFISDHFDIFKKYEIKFVDPHDGAGGFGASSAQFAGAYQCLHSEVSIDALLDTYQHYAYRGTGFPPSGADVISQLYWKDITYFSKKDGMVKTYDWPFSDLTYELIQTGNKVATHEHLAVLGNFSCDKLSLIVEDTVHAIERVDSSKFCDAIRAYREELLQIGLTCSNTHNLLLALDQDSNILASKGCGALGADIILSVRAPNEASVSE